MDSSFFPTVATKQAELSTTDNGHTIGIIQNNETPFFAFFQSI